MSKNGIANGKRLEHEIADYFGVARNTARNGNYGMTDSDVDVRNYAGGDNSLIIECKFRGGLNLGKELKDFKLPDNHIGCLMVYTGRRKFAGCRLSDFHPLWLQDFKPELDPSYIRPEVWIKSLVMRQGAKFLDDWMDKLVNTYLPLKSIEFSVPTSSLVPIIALRAKHQEPILLWESTPSISQPHP